MKLLRASWRNARKRCFRIATKCHQMKQFQIDSRRIASDGLFYAAMSGANVYAPNGRFSGFFQLIKLGTSQSASRTAAMASRAPNRLSILCAWSNGACVNCGTAEQVVSVASCIEWHTFNFHWCMPRQRHIRWMQPNFHFDDWRFGKRKSNASSN